MSVEWITKKELREAAKRIHDRVANGDQPHEEDLEMFPVCPRCEMYRLGDECPAKCVYGHVVPVEV